MNSALDLLNNKDLIQDPNANKYQIDGLFVPRVNDILSAMLHEDYLMTWSNNIGLYQKKKYSETLKQAADIGSFTHEAIEKYVKNNKYPSDLPLSAMNAFKSFLEWWKIINTHKVKVLMQEQQLVWKYFGGTLDMLIEIDDKVYLVDFKTSNHLSYKHFLQLSAYAYMLKEIYSIDVDGCIILMLSKKYIYFEEFMLNLSEEYSKNFFKDCTETFLSLAYSYYCRLNVTMQFGNIFGGIS